VEKRAESATAALQRVEQGGRAKEDLFTMYALEAWHVGSSLPGCFDEDASGQGDVSRRKSSSNAIAFVGNDVEGIRAASLIELIEQEASSQDGLEVLGPALSSLDQIVALVQEAKARKQVYNRIWRLLLSHGQRRSSPWDLPMESSSTWAECLRLLLRGLTDVWSEIRKSCAKHAASFCCVLSWPAVEMMWKTQLTLLDSTSSSHWREQDGALAAIRAFLAQFEKDKGVDSTRASLSSSSFFRLGPYHRFERLPGIIKAANAPVLALTQHPQHHVREKAVEVS